MANTEKEFKPLGIVDFSVERKVTITILILIIVVFGFISFTRLGLDMLPDINYPVVTVATQYKGAAPADIEERITKPMEGTIASVNRVKKITSTTAEGVSAVMVEFEWGTNLDYAAQDIRDNIAFIKDYLPEDASEPAIFKFNLGSIPIMFTGVTGKGSSYELRKMVKDNVADRLARVEGVASAAISGGDTREIRVNVDPDKLAARGIGIDQVVMALRAQNMNLPAGYLVRNQTDYLLRAIGEFTSLTDIRNTVVGAGANGNVIRLMDVAEVRDGFSDKRYSMDMNGRPSLFMIITKRSGANTLLVCRRVNKELEKLKQELQSSDIEFHEIFDQGKPISQITNSTAKDALIGACLAILFMFLFLRNVRPTIAISVAIPFSVIVTFIALYAAGYTLNLMTLGGIALGVGRLVDDAVVVIENIFRHMQMGMNRNEAAKRGASEVGMAVTASTMTTVVVFLPIFFATGLAGQLAKGLALTIIFSLLASLFVAMTIVPMLASAIFRIDQKEEKVAWTEALGLWYEGMLTKALRNPKRVAFIVAGVLVITIVAAVFRLGGEFMPKGDSSMVMLTMEMPIGTPLKETQDIAYQVRDMLRTFPEVRTVGTSAGRNEEDQGNDPAQASGTHVAQFFVLLKDRKDRDKTSMQLTDEFRERLPKTDAIKFNFTDMGMSMGMGATKPVNIKVFGKDFEVIRGVCERIKDGIKDVEGLRDLEISLAKGRPEYHFIIKTDKAIRYGLTAYQVENAVQAATLGQVATRYRTGGEEIDVRVQLAENYRKSIESIRRIPLKLPQGGTIPLEQICEFKNDQGPVIIQRDNQYRLATVQANISGRDINTIVKDIKPRIAEINKSLPPGYFIEFGGEYQDMMDAFVTLAQALAIAVLLVFMVMAAQFESLVHPFVIMFTMPLALIGVLWGFILTNTRISVVTLIGVIMLAGIVVTNGIVLVDYVNQLRRKGRSVHDALVEGGRTRMRPILITAGTTIMALIPMFFIKAEGAEFQSPMALTVIGGLLTATVLTLFVIPILYQWLDALSEKVKAKVLKKVHG